MTIYHKEKWEVGKRVIAIKNINIDGDKIKKGSIGTILSYKLGFGSNEDYWFIHFKDYGEYEFRNYDKRNLKIYRGKRK